MPDRIQSTRVICEGGLDSTENYLNLSQNKPGSATRLVNYEAGLSGGYRRLNGYEAYDTDFPEVGVGVATGRVFGIVIFDNSITGATQIFAARRNIADNEYQIYEYQFGTGWVAVTTGLTHYYINGGAEVNKIRYDVGNDGNRNHLCIVDGVNPALIYDGSTWGYITTSGTGTDIANAGGAQAIAAPTLVSFFSGTLFLSYDRINGALGQVAYSAPNDFVNFDSADGAGQVITGLEVVQIKPFRDFLYVFGTNAIKRIAPDVTAGFIIRDVTNNIGCIARDSVVEIGGDLVFLAPDGFRPIAGTSKIGDVQLETLSKSIHSLIRTRISASSLIDVNSVVIRGKSQFRIFFSSSNVDAANTRGIIGCLRTSNQTTGWEFGEILGFRASASTSRYVNGIEVVLHGDYDGNVYRQERGNSLNGGDMLSVYSTPYLDFGDTEIRKTIEGVTIFLSGEGQIDVSLGVQYDWGRREIPAPPTYDIIIDALVPTYDDPSFTYDDPDVVYGGALTPIAVEKLEGSFFSARFTFTSIGTRFPHSIYAMVVEYKPEGRR